MVNMTNAEFSFSKNFFERNDLRMHYVDEGQGDPVVMVHGNPTWSFYYRGLINALKDNYRCIVPDHIGCGLSDKPGDAKYDYTLASRVADLDALLKYLDVREKITLIVHDWGGMIGLTWAAKNHEKIKQIVVLNTSAFHLPKTKPMPWQLIFCRMPVLGAILVRGFNGFCRYALKHCTKRRPLGSDVAAKLIEPYDNWNNRIAVHRFVQDIPLKRGERAYDLVSATEAGVGVFKDRPLMVCWGLQDFVF